MPLSVSFDIPFPPQVNPHLETGGNASLEWVLGRGLIRSEEGRRAFVSWDLPQAIARAYPRAEAEAFVQVLNFFAVGFLLDDQFDPDVPHRGEHVANVVREMITIPFRSLDAPLELVCPITTAHQEIWRHMALSMSPGWCDRFAANFARFLCAHVREISVSHREMRLEDYVHLRRQSVGIIHSLDLTEWSGRFEVPLQVVAHPLFRDLRWAAVDTIAFMNDVHSVEREERRGDPHNLVLVLERDHGCTRDAAIADAVRMTRQAMARFCDLTARLPTMHADLGLNGAEREAVELSVAGARSWIRGNHDWALTSGRYSGLAEAAYVDDLLIREGA